MTQQPKITIAQANFTVGDIAGNCKKIIEISKANSSSDIVSNIIVFPELCVSGYPPEDLILLDYFVESCMQAAQNIANATKNLSCAIIIGCPWLQAEKNKNSKIYNAALLIQNGEIKFKQFKRNLPNYGIFDEKRIFSAGKNLQTYNLGGCKLGILICEDTWHLKNAKQLSDADIFISINASPFEVNKQKTRYKIAQKIVKKYGKPLIYANLVSAQDDIVFDGGSFVLNSNAKITQQLDFFTEVITPANLTTNYQLQATNPLEQTYCAMVFALQDYVNKNNFKGVIMGMSGGIDSAISAAIAVDALGAERVRLVMLPSKFTSNESKNDAAKCAKNLGITLETISIEQSYNALESSLEKSFKGAKADLTEENLQSRIRGVLLMALSNKFGYMVLSTGNKSELATGYATLYGDMCGGYNCLKDVYKTQVFKLAKWRNKNICPIGMLQKTNIIPKNIITKAPSAELRANQTDQDSLPPYDVLDAILTGLIEQQKSVQQIIEQGQMQEVVEKVAKLLNTSEYKRRQSAPGVKISAMSFSRDRRFPLTSKFKFSKL
jgi:NAD+ synthase